MFFFDTLIRTVQKCNMKKIGDFLQFHLCKLSQKTGLKVKDAAVFSMKVLKADGLKPLFNKGEDV